MFLHRQFRPGRHRQNERCVSEAFLCRCILVPRSFTLFAVAYSSPFENVVSAKRAIRDPRAPTARALSSARTTTRRTNVHVPCKLSIAAAWCASRSPTQNKHIAGAKLPRAAAQARADMVQRHHRACGANVLPLSLPANVCGAGSALDH